MAAVEADSTNQDVGMAARVAEAVARKKAYCPLLSVFCYQNGLFYLRGQQHHLKLGRRGHSSASGQGKWMPQAVPQQQQQLPSGSPLQQQEHYCLKEALPGCILLE